MSSNEITVEDGIPIPDKGRRRLSGVTKTMRGLEVGHSFECETARRANLFTVAKTIGIKITTRSEGDKMRVWRVE